MTRLATRWVLVFALVAFAVVAAMSVAGVHSVLADSGPGVLGWQ